MPTHPFSRIACASLALLLLAAPAYAQGGAAPLHVEFRATTNDGQPISDLKPADVSVRVDGKAREVRGLQFIGAPPAGTAAPAEPPFATNTAGRTRTFVVVLDEGSLSAGREAQLKEALLKFVDAMAPGDRVAFSSVRMGGLAVGATADRAKIKETINGIQSAALTESPSDFQCRTATALQALTEMFSAPAAASPQTVFLVITSALSPPPAQQQTVRIGQGSALCQLEPRHFEMIGNAASTARAGIFISYYAEGLHTPSSEAAAGVENVAGVVKTPLIRLTGSNLDTLANVARSTAGWYVATVDIEPRDRNGQPHRLELNVSRERVDVRAPWSIVIAKPAKAASPRDMLRVPTAYADLPLRALAMASRNPGDDKIKVIALIEPGEPGTKLTAAALGFFDEKGKLVAQWSAQEADLSRPMMMGAVTLAPGKYRMRAAAVDASGRGGTADGDLAAVLVQAGPLRLSAPMLGISQGGNFAPRLQFTAADTAAIGYLEIYGVTAEATPTVTLELAPSENAPAMATATTQVQGKDDMRAAFGGFDISRLEPGDYVLRAIVSLDGKPVGRTMRTMRKTQ